MRRGERRERVGERGKYEERKKKIGWERGQYVERRKKIENWR